MNTKRSAARCKIPTGRKPTRRRWEIAVHGAVECINAVKQLFRFSRAAASEDPLPAAHIWPAYNGECWRQAYEEMLAIQMLAYAFRAYEAAKLSGYMPEKELAKYLAAYTLARVQYLVAWGAMEDCLNMTV